MAEQSLEPRLAQERRIAIGRSLLSSLERLGIEPDLLFWAIIEDEFQLVMVTTLADRVGPLPLYELLFEAQDKKMISDEVPLMELSIYSPKSEIGIDFDNAFSNVSETGHLPFGRISQDEAVDDVHFHVGFTDPVDVSGRELFYVRKKGFSAVRDLDRWHKAERFVHQQAA